MGAGAARDSWIALGLCCRSGIPVYVVDHRVRLQTPRPKTHQQTHQHRCVDVRKRLYGLALLMTNVGLTFFATFGQPRGEALSNHQLGDSGLGRRPYDFACSAGPPDTGRPLSVLSLSCCSSCGPGVVGWACTLLTYFFFLGCPVQRQMAFPANFHAAGAGISALQPAQPGSACCDAQAV